MNLLYAAKEEEQMSIQQDFEAKLDELKDLAKEKAGDAMEAESEIEEKLKDALHIE
ncbi:MAG TPA: hypothetical protein VLI04_20225 [Nocardioidaceae bacterium]|nr:hypothetical protein [Nocardioidaceae bacterium]